MRVSEEHSRIVEAYKSQLLIALVGGMGGRVELDLKHVDEFPVGKGLAVSIQNMKEAPELGEGRFTGTFVLQLVEIPIQKTVFIDNRVVGEG